MPCSCSECSVIFPNVRKYLLLFVITLINHNDYELIMIMRMVGLMDHKGYTGKLGFSVFITTSDGII